MGSRRRSRLGQMLLAAVAAAAAAAGLAASPGTARGPRVRAAGKGSVSVLFAGSLVAYLERGLGPAFAHATGYGFDGFGGGSTELANEIKGGIRQGDVFVSASAKADTALEGAGNGGWVSWYSSFLATPLELAYNPHSRFGRELARGTPWYRVLTQAGVRVGRTDPRLDPKGVLTSEAIEVAARRLHDPALQRAETHFETFPETSLVGRMQAGQLDAGFFYAVEAKTAGLAIVTLAPVYKYAEYTLTILNHARNAAGAQAFVRYLIGASRRSSLARNGLNPSGPRLVGSAASAPRSLRSLVGAG
jgi:molybdate/tungstate transport system substrate-binding protein